jgi:hypothetical protein
LNFFDFFDVTRVPMGKAGCKMGSAPIESPVESDGSIVPMESDGPIATTALHFFGIAMSPVKVVGPWR